MVEQESSETTNHSYLHRFRTNQFPTRYEHENYGVDAQHRELEHIERRHICTEYNIHQNRSESVVHGRMIMMDRVVERHYVSSFASV